MIKKPPKEAPDPIDVHVGRLVRIRRKSLGLSQTKLGEAIGVTFQQVQKYENGSNRISASSLYKIAVTLDVEAAFFFEGLDFSGPGLKEESSIFMHDPNISDETIELMHNLSEIGDKEVFKRLLHFIKTLVQSTKN